MPSIMTIGIYGFDEASFFSLLVKERVSTFCDIRMRRGVRGSMYSFANSIRLQNKLASLGINYVHEKGLAPTTAIRTLQKEADRSKNETKRNRQMLTTTFSSEFQAKLDDFDFLQFFRNLQGFDQVIVFCCVEQLPSACHRSLVASYLQDKFGFFAKDLLP